MAGHLPVKTTMFRLALIEEAKNELQDIKENFKRVPLTRFKKYRAMRLPVEDYNMDDETGLEDSSVISVERDKDILEFHLDNKGKLNAIYLVM